MKINNYNDFLNFVEIMVSNKSLPIESIGKDNYNAVLEYANRLSIINLMFVKIADCSHNIDISSLIIMNSLLGLNGDCQNLWDEYLAENSRIKMKAKFLQALEVLETHSEADSNINELFDEKFCFKLLNITFSSHWEILKTILWGVSNSWISSINELNNISALEMLERFQLNLEDNDYDSLNLLED